MARLPVWINLTESRPPSDRVVLREREQIVEPARMMNYDAENGLGNELTWLVFDGDDTHYDQARVTDMWRLMPLGEYGGCGCDLD